MAAPGSISMDEAIANMMRPMLEKYFRKQADSIKEPVKENLNKKQKA